MTRKHSNWSSQYSGQKSSTVKPSRTKLSSKLPIPVFDISRRPLCLWCFARNLCSNKFIHLDHVARLDSENNIPSVLTYLHEKTIVSELHCCDSGLLIMINRESAASSHSYFSLFACDRVSESCFQTFFKIKSDSSHSFHFFYLVLIVLKTDAFERNQ